MTSKRKRSRKQRKKVGNNRDRLTGLPEGQAIIPSETVSSQTSATLLQSQSFTVLSSEGDGEIASFNGLQSIGISLSPDFANFSFELKSLQGNSAPTHVELVKNNVFWFQSYGGFGFW